MGEQPEHLYQKHSDTIRPVCMPAMASQKASEHISYQRCYRQIFGLSNANLSEARLCRIAAEDDTYNMPPSRRFAATKASLMEDAADLKERNSFLKAFEGGGHDCAEWFGPIRLPRNLTSKLMTALTSDELDPCGAYVLPIDIKTFSPIWHQREKVLKWKCEFTESQTRACQAVIMSTHKDPWFVALVPLHYIRKNSDPSVKKLYVNSLKFKIDWTLHAVPAWPPEWGPFQLPTTQIRNGLDLIRDYVDGRESTWYSILFVYSREVLTSWLFRRNPHTGVAFREAPPPELHPLSTLQPEFAQWKAAFRTAEPILNAFKHHSSDWVAEFPDIAPVLGDIKFTHRSGVEISVELKIEHCWIDTNMSTNCPVLYHRQNALGFVKRLIFSWRAYWDYIITVPKARAGISSGYALCLPRDDIPEYWFDSSPRMRDAQGLPILQWESKEFDWLGPYKLDLEDPQGLVRAMEQIFGSDPLRMKATRTIPMTSGPLKALLEDEDKLDFQSANKDKQPTESGPSFQNFRIGFGSAEHPFIWCPEVYEYWAFECLTELCQLR